MGYQIVKQPDDRFAIFSSYTDTIIVWDATQDEIEDWFVDLAVEEARRSVRKALGHVVADEPRKAYFQFAMTWEEALAEDQEREGEAWRQFKTLLPPVESETP